MVAKQLDISRTAAQEIIRSGYVQIAGYTILKPGMPFSEETTIFIENGSRAFVGRGGDKLEAALEKFALDAHNQVCLDVGASTGGFTDCLLKRGAAKVYAIENGKDQLAAQLKANPKVISMEETDIRNVVLQWFDEPITFAVVDVSFISLTKVLEPIVNVLAPSAKLICLIKPQFEAGKGKVNKRGIVKDQKIRQQVIDKVCDYAHTLGFSCKGIFPFPDTPPKNKNQEFLVYFTNE